MTPLVKYLLKDLCFTIKICLVSHPTQDGCSTSPGSSTITRTNPKSGKRLGVVGVSVWSKSSSSVAVSRGAGKFEARKSSSSTSFGGGKSSKSGTHSGSYHIWDPFDRKSQHRGGDAIPIVLEVLSVDTIREGQCRSRCETSPEPVSTGQGNGLKFGYV